MAQWLTDLRSRIEAQTERMVTLTGAELREIVTSCGVADLRLRALAEKSKPDAIIELKRRTVLELIRSCRFQRAVAVASCRRAKAIGGKMPPLRRSTP